MHDWIAINPHDLHIAQSHSGGFSGVEIIVGLSPDDIPARVRGCFDRTTNEFVIELQYGTVTNEPKRVIDTETAGAAVPVLGQFSGRLYELRFKTPLRDLSHQLRQTIDSLSQDTKLRNRLRHFEVAGEAVRDHEDALLQH